MPDEAQRQTLSPSAPRVIVNDRPLIGPRTGVGQYLAGVLGAWPEDRPAPTGVISRVSRDRLTRVSPCPFVPGPLSSLSPVLRTELRAMRPRSDARASITRGAKRSGYALAARSALASMRRRSGTVYFEPNHHPLINARPGSPVVTTIHDLSVLQRPEFHPPDRVRAWAAALPKTLERTSAFIAVSKATARVIEQHLGIEPKLIHPIPLAPRFAPAPEGWSKRACRKALGLNPDRGLVVHLGTVEPRKNISVLLEVWKILSESRPKLPELLLVGSPGWGNTAFWHELTSHTLSDRVRSTGYVPDQAAMALLVAADVVVCPSWLEGFGLPAVEAMHAGTPVLVSTDPALTEAAGEAAPAIDPGDAAGWAQAISELLDNPELASERATAGRAQTSHRTWHDVAREHASVFAGVR